ncbi:MAG: CoA transferase [Chloroflexi bacterium]|nr:CoA transferase [Chloroflexota bacterium]
MIINALEGVRVLDLTHHVAGPQCTKLLADYGADVIKIERPLTGDPARSIGPFYHDDPHPEKSGLFLHLNTNKRSVTLNLKDKTGQEIARRLAQNADIVIESFRPGVIADMGLDYPTIEKLNPSVVFTSISNFGQTGPYRDLNASEIVSFAMGGAMNITGHAEREPLKLGSNVIAYHSGSVAAYSTMLALYQAEDDGEGQFIDVSIYLAQAGSRDRRTIYLTGYAYVGETGQRAHPENRLASGTRPCADGYVNILGFGGGRFASMCRMIGQPELAEHPLLNNPMTRTDPEAIDLFDSYYIPWLMEHTKREAVAIAQEHHLLAGPINTVEDLLSDPHFKERDYWDKIEHPYTGEVTYPGNPIKMHGVSSSPTKHAPLLGEHTAEVLVDELGYSREELVFLRASGVI